MFAKQSIACKQYTLFVILCCTDGNLLFFLFVCELIKYVKSIFLVCCVSIAVSKSFSTKSLQWSLYRLQEFMSTTGDYSHTFPMCVFF